MGGGFWGQAGRPAGLGPFLWPRPPAVPGWELLRLTHARFYQHLVSPGEDGLQMLFCHRWLLLCFKRGVSEAEALRIWEACWAHYQVSQAGASRTRAGCPRESCKGHLLWGPLAPPSLAPTGHIQPLTRRLPSSPTWPASNLQLASQVTEIDANCPLTALITMFWG